MPSSQKINFVMTGSILGGRGVEALATLQELIAIENSRCLVVLWEDEAHTSVFEAMQALPVELLVVPPPSLAASGNMTRQHLSFVSALPFFQPDDFLVRVRTDHNCRLGPIMNLLSVGRQRILSELGDKVIVGAVSLLLPGRVEDFNYAGRRRAFDRFMWCESYFTEDYLPELNADGLAGQPYFSAEPELRWAGLYYAMKNPLYSFLYSKFNRYDLPFHFIENHVRPGEGPHKFPTIVRYLVWQLANDYCQDFMVVRDTPSLSCTPENLFSFDDEQLSQLVDLNDNKDIRVSSQLAVESVAGATHPGTEWDAFLEPAINLAKAEKQTPGAVLEELHRFMAPARANTIPSYRYNKVSAPAEETSRALLSAAQKIAANEPYSTLRYAKSKLLAIRNATSQEFESLLAQYDVSGGVKGQHMDGFAGFFAVLVSKLVDSGKHAHALEMLEQVFVEQGHNIQTFVDTLKTCTTCYAPDANRQKLLNDNLLATSQYELPNNYNDYHLVGDFLFHAAKLQKITPDHVLLQDLMAALKPEIDFHLN